MLTELLLYCYFIKLTDMWTRAIDTLQNSIDNVDPVMPNTLM